MEQIGKVIQSANGQAEVLVKRQGACGENCASCAGCSFSQKKVFATNLVHARPGDIVKLEIGDRAALWAAFLVYVLPVLLLLLSYGVCFVLTSLEWLSVTVCLLVLLVYFVFFRRVDKGLSKYYEIKITKIINDS